MRLREGWEVEWCSRLPVMEDGSSDFDRATYCVRDFTDPESAFKYASTVSKKAVFGTASVTQFHTEDGSREYDGETEHVES